jgi:drug/metabolite transporter (DMT)-like permease
MWRAGVWLLPLAVWEIALKKFPVSTNLILIQLYCIIAGGVVAFGIWNNGLRQWPTSRVYLFNNLIPLSTATWAHFCLAEKIAPTFWVAMMLVAAGVALGQMNFFGKPGEVVAETETTIEL